MPNIDTAVYSANQKYKTKLNCKQPISCVLFNILTKKNSNYYASICIYIYTP